MARGKSKEHPEWSEKYPAIDGIAKEQVAYQHDRTRPPVVDVPNQEPIRSDVEAILELGDDEFEEWYRTRKETAERLLRDYETVGSIPDLWYAHEQQQLTIRPYMNIIGVLEKGLEYLDIIKQARDERKESDNQTK